jgi:hypothetical protein
MDLAKLDTLNPAEEGTVVELEHPVTKDPIIGDDGKPWTISVRGEDSATVRTTVKKLSDKRWERLRKGKKYDSDQDDADLVEKLASATIGWHGLILDGEPYQFSRENAKKLYADPRFPWIVEQVQLAMVDRQRFFTNASNS